MKVVSYNLRWPIYWLVMAFTSVAARMITNAIHHSPMDWGYSLENAAIFATLMAGTMRLLKIWR